MIPGTEYDLDWMTRVWTWWRY